MSTRNDGPSPRISEAVGIVAEQVGCGEDEALRRLTERADAFQYRIHNYALFVIDGIIRFDPDPAPT
jgi:hypothetical protein